jgi:uncharacterized membrane protein
MARRSKAPGRAPRAAKAANDLPPATADTAATAANGTRVARRWPVIDFFRGCAMLAMIVYHFCFDLAFNGWLIADFGEDWRWIGFRIPILGSFLLIAGVSLGLAQARGQTGAQFWQRVGIIAGAAALVSLGSYTMFPDSFIFFGVLHAIALMSILARPALRWGWWTLVLGLAVLALGVTVQHPFFDQPPLHWIGLMTFKPRAEDYVPLFPWFGLLLIGAGVGTWAAQHSSKQDWLLAWVAPRCLGWVTWLGRHSLVVYLLHQPLLLGAMLLLRSLQ